MAKGDDTGIAQLGQKLDPMQGNYGGGNGPQGGYGSFNHGMFQPSIGGPSQDLLGQFFQNMFGKAAGKAQAPGQIKAPGTPATGNGAIKRGIGGAGAIQQGIQRLKGNKQSMMQPPQQRMMPPGMDPNAFQQGEDYLNRLRNNGGGMMPPQMTDNFGGVQQGALGRMLGGGSQRNFM